ncbi:hypothetical protein N7495_000867 [Penicillium taxi]|uniref:uncharacterized protein n=1 Tax=Penicillium taxi TaxID=168475 RepID=UPI0025450DBE|nr:uncharacterized protein N7495_000867 [Penicillium taxi]KAJ5908185.1 hypothetical protein N7495_000867 [Penicillium taxi]
MDHFLQTWIAMLLVPSRYTEIELNLEFASDEFDGTLRNLALHSLWYADRQSRTAYTPVVIVNKVLESHILFDGPRLMLFVDSNGIIYPTGASQKHSQVVRMVDQVHYMMGQIASARPRSRVQNIDLVSQAELQTLKAWNGQPLPLADKYLHQLVLDTAKLWPERKQ